MELGLILREVWHTDLRMEREKNFGRDDVARGEEENQVWREGRRGQEWEIRLEKK